ncbi:MAG: bifunctional glycosyltransferase family 2/GtrA family protein [Deltaproteobacteria bacterium]|nr:bifunctional glycosyltransferase family 2/GtrA family protein [Deltaproteobacteria bacterium]
MTPKLSLVVPCFNESATLERCVARILAIATPSLPLEIVIVDDASRDDSLAIARGLEARHPEVRVFAHERNRGKGAALRTGFERVTGDFVAVQDADLEYDPRDLVGLLVPLEDGRADAVLGSRYRAEGLRRVRQFWHTAGNRFLTFVSNLFTDLELTDLETCYKVFRRDVIQSIGIEEDRFGFEPEIVAKLAGRRLRIYEASIDYAGRTYAEGKKIRARDGWRALYCIIRYNADHAPRAMRFLVYAGIGVVAGLVDVALFAGLRGVAPTPGLAIAAAYGLAAFVNLLLCRAFLFPVATAGVLARYAVVAVAGLIVDLGLTRALVETGIEPIAAKLLALLPFPVFNFVLRDRFVFSRATAMQGVGRDGDAA